MSRPDRPAARSPDVGCSVAWNFGCRDVAGLALVAIWWWCWIVVQVASPQPISSATRYPSRPIACSSAAPEIRRHPSPHPNSTRASTPPPRSPPSPTGCATSPRPALAWPICLPPAPASTASFFAMPCASPLAGHRQHRRLACAPDRCPQTSRLWGLGLRVVRRATRDFTDSC